MGFEEAAALQMMRWNILDLFAVSLNKISRQSSSLPTRKASLTYFLRLICWRLARSNDMLESYLYQANRDYASHAFG